MRRLVQGFLALALLAAAGCGTPEFKPFNSEEGRFTVLMPGEPQRKEMSVMKLKCIGFGVKVWGGAYAVGFMDIPPGTPFSLDGAVQGLTRHHEGKVLSNKSFSLAGSVGKEFEIESAKPKGYVSGRVIRYRTRFYQVLAMGTDARLTNSDVRKYLDSFDITR
jgi:hypothetical protein